MKDNYNRLGSAQAFTSTGGVCTDTLVLPNTGQDIAAGEPLCLRFTFSAVSAVSGTIQCQVVTATASNGTSGQVVLATLPAITDTSLAAGSKLFVPIPPGLIPIAAATATHLTGKIVLASSGTCTATTDIIPLSHADVFQTYNAYPALQ